MGLENRVEKLEHWLPKQRPDIEDMTDDELARSITGNPAAKAGDLTDEQLQEIVDESRRQNIKAGKARCG